MKAIKQTAIICMGAALFGVAGPEWSQFLWIALTLVLAAATGAAMTTLALAGESFILTTPMWFFMGVNFLLSERHELLPQFTAMTLGLGIGAAGVFFAMLLATADPTDED